MVGVPGRSKGCTTCKKRKKKCDLRQPTCINCAKAGFVCGGYKRDMILVHVDPAGKGIYKPGPETTRKEQIYFRHKILLVDIRTKVLNRTALETECFEEFWSLYLPKPEHTSQTESRSMVPLKSWAELTSHYISQSDILRCALLAIGASQVGLAKGDRALVERGMELYGQTLSSLSLELETKKYAKKFDLLAVCRLLALYEQSNGVETNIQIWCKHVKGLLTFVQLYSPGLFSMPGKHVMFLESRYNGMVAAITEHKSTFLSQPEWMTEPWHSIVRTEVDTATDLLLQLPAVLEEWDAMDLQSQTPEAVQRVNELKRTCLSLEAELQKWYIEFYFANAAAEQTEYSGLPLEMNVPKNQNKLGLATLHAMMLYWTCCILLYDTTAHIYYAFPSPNSAGLFPRYLVTKITTCCQSIAKSAHYFLQPSAGLAAAIMVSFPLGCAARALQQQQQRQWLFGLASGALKDVQSEVEQVWNTARQLRAGLRGENHST